MRTRSHVYTLYQMPETLFGIAPRLLMVALGVAILVMVSMMMILPMLSFLLSIVSFFMAALWAWRATRRDPHVESVMMLSHSWWRGKKQRWLIGGARSVTPKRTRT